MPPNPLEHKRANKFDLTEICYCRADFIRPGITTFEFGRINKFDPTPGYPNSSQGIRLYEIRIKFGGNFVNFANNTLKLDSN